MESIRVSVCRVFGHARFGLDLCLLSLCQYCVCSKSIQAPASPIPSQAHPSVCGKTSHSASLAQRQCRSSGYVPLPSLDYTEMLIVGEHIKNTIILSVSKLGRRFNGHLQAPFGLLPRIVSIVKTVRSHVYLRVRSVVLGGLW